MHLLLGKPSLNLQFGQNISLLIMRRSKRSVSDFACSDEYKRAVSESARSCAEVMSLVIEDCKSPYDLIRYMFGQLSGFSPRSRPAHVGIDKRLFQQRSSLGHSSSNQRARWHRIAGKNRGLSFTFLTCYLFSACYFLFLCYISGRHLTFKLLKLNKVCVI